MRPNTDEVIDQIISFYAKTILPLAKDNVDALFTFLVLMLVRGYHGAEPKNLYEANLKIRKVLQQSLEKLKAEDIHLAALDATIPKNSFSIETFPTVEELREDNRALNEVLENLILQIYDVENPAPVVDEVLTDLRATMKIVADDQYESIAPVLAQVMNTLP